MPAPQGKEEPVMKDMKLIRCVFAGSSHIRNFLKSILEIY